MLLDVLYDQGSIDEKVFSLSIGYSDRNNSNSIVTIGGYDLEKYAIGELNWHYLRNNSRHWDVNLTSLKFGDTSLTSKTTGITVDSGSSLLVVPRRVLKNLRNNLNL